MPSLYTPKRPIPKLVGDDLNDPQALRDFASQSGVEIPEKKEGGFLGTLSKALDILNAGAYSVGGWMSGTKAAEGRKQRISPGIALLGKPDPNQPLAQRMGLGVTRFVADVVFDPLTYATLGTGTMFRPAIKVGMQGFEKVILNKTGKE